MDQYGLEESSQETKKQKKLPRSRRSGSMDSAPTHIWVWRLLKPLIITLISLAIVVMGLKIAYDKVMSDYFSPVDENSTQEVSIVIPSGSSLSKVSALLEEEGIIRNKTIFKYYVDFSDQSAKIKAGTFTLSPSMTLNEIIDIITTTPEDITSIIKVTLTEGMTLEDMADKMKDEYGMLFDRDRLLEIAKTAKGFDNNGYINAVLATENADQRRYALEGYLFPDTYDFYIDTSEQEILNRMVLRFGEIMQQNSSYRQRAEALGYTLDEIITLASMIEKEAKVADFKKVSAVFHNRLKKDWELGSDATVQYATGVESLTFTDEQLAVDSPYNTYQNKGLPLGPICNPGKAAIEAALYPDEQTMDEGYMFFCLGDPETGETVFTKTLEEHNAAVAKYAPMWAEYNTQ